jgi:UDP-N-acetyl-D-galactosamine dehydrogenase
MKNTNIAVIGLGYVGLPLLIEISEYYNSVGFDINNHVVKELKSGKDNRNILDNEEKSKLPLLKISNDQKVLSKYNIFIITVPTPLDEYQNPDLEPLKKASMLVSKYIKKGSLVIFESTVYPGCTEDFCIPIIEKYSGMKLNKDFYCGYSPERVNPGDKKRKIAHIKKITSGSNVYALNIVDKIYKKFITAGTHQVKSIKVAEMSKVIENIQRDLNIGLMNEVSIICHKLGIDTEEVITAASTKWNFLNFKPGLVGGHCISIDPYYLTHKAKQINYHPELILAARRLNDLMPKFIVSEFIEKMNKKGIKIKDSEILIFGVTFKENVSDMRNSKVIEIIQLLSKLDVKVKFYDPNVSLTLLPKQLKKMRVTRLKNQKFDGIIYAVNHSKFSDISLPQIKHLLKFKSVVYDIQSTLPRSVVDIRL